MQDARDEQHKTNKVEEGGERTNLGWGEADAIGAGDALRIRAAQAIRGRADGDHGAPGLLHGRGGRSSGGSGDFAGDHVGALALRGGDGKAQREGRRSGGGVALDLSVRCVCVCVRERVCKRERERGGEK